MSDPRSPRLVRRPLSRQIADILRGRVLSECAPGDRFPPETRLAEEFGVSALTIREALAFLVQEGLIVRKRGSGTWVAERSGARFLAVVCGPSQAHRSASFFFQRVLQEVCDGARDRGLPHRLYTGHGHAASATPQARFGENWDDLLEAVEGGLVEGAVVINGDVASDWCRAMRARGVPLVGHGRVYDHSVRISHGEIARRGVERLAALGRRRIALVGWGRGIVTGAFREAVEEQELRTRDAWIRADYHPCASGSGWRAFTEIWSGGDEKPDGLVVTDEVLFESVGPALLSLGIRVPDDLAVVRHANRGAGVFSPFPVDRLEIDPAALAHEMLDLQVELAEAGAAEPPHRVIHPDLLLAGQAEEETLSGEESGAQTRAG